MTHGREPAGAVGRLALLVALLLGFIVYASLWPFGWRALPPGTSVPALIEASLLHAAPGGRGDLLANVLLYIPFGLLLGALLPPGWPHPARLLLPILAGALLSAALEAAQLFVPARVTSGFDLALNTLGTAIGAAAALAVGGRAMLGGGRRGPADPMAGLLVLAWLGWRFYPYVPAIDWQAWKDNLKPLLLEPRIETLRLATLLASWTSAALMAEAAAGRAVARWLVPLGLAGALAAEVVIPGKSLTLTETLAIGGALLTWALLRERDWAPPVMAAAMLFAVLVERLEPFTFTGPPRAFTWLPFAGLIGGSLGAGVQATLAKLFLQGALLFWLCRSGLRLPLAAGLQAALVLAASIAQCWLPDRSAEIADTLLVILLALGFHLLRPALPQQGWRMRAMQGGAA